MKNLFLLLFLSLLSFTSQAQLVTVGAGGIIYDQASDVDSRKTVTFMLSGRMHGKTTVANAIVTYGTATRAYPARGVDSSDHSYLDVMYEVGALALYTDDFEISFLGSVGMQSVNATIESAGFGLTGMLLVPIYKRGAVWLRLNQEVMNLAREGSSDRFNFSLVPTRKSLSIGAALRFL